MAAFTNAEIEATDFFKADEYVLSKAALMVSNGKAQDLASAKAKFEAAWTGDMIDHYVSYGAAENANPSNLFDNSSYISFVANEEVRDWAEVRAELNANDVSPLRDFLERGQDLGYDAPAVPADEQVDGNVTPSVEGETYFLDEGRDVLSGTVNDDTFIADVGQNQHGELSNALATGDRIDGGAGTDTFNITLMDDESTANNTDMHVRPITEDVEIVNITALEDVVLDAKAMQDVTTVNMVQSKYDLTINDLTTLQSSGSTLKVSEMTVGMKFTGNNNDAGNVTQDAADMAVYFDQDYLVPEVIGDTDTETVSLRMMNRDAQNYIEQGLDTDNEYGPLSGVFFSFFQFELAGEMVVLTDFIQPLEAVLEGLDASADPRGGTGQGVKTYAEAVALLNEALENWKASAEGEARLEEINSGLTSPLDWDQLQFSLGDTFTTTTADSTTLTGNVINFTAPVSTSMETVLNMTGDYFEMGVSLSDADKPSADELKAAGLEDWASDRMERAELEEGSVSESQELRINVDLHKVGLGSDGGGLIIGGMSNEDNNTWGDGSGSTGIEIFDVTVDGNANQDTSMAYLHSTNNTLQEVYVTDHADWSGADLEIGNMNTTTNSLKDVKIFNSTAFSGNVDLNDVVITDEAFVTSTTDKYAGDNANFSYNFGGGNDGLEMTVSGAPINLDSDFNLDIDMGAGDNNAAIVLDGDVVDALGESFSLTTGGGNDVVNVDMTEGVSYETMTQIGATQTTYLDINTGAGNDRIALDDYGTFDIVAGSGNDYIEIDANDGTDLSGGWTIFANTDFDTFGARVFYNAKMTVSFAGFETTIDIATTAAGSFVATQAFIASEIKRAIDSDDTLSEFLTVTIAAGSNQVLISSDIDGENSLAIAIFQPELLSTGTPTADQTLIGSGDVNALRIGLIATEAVLSNDLETASEIATWTAGNTWEGQVDDTGLGDDTDDYSAAQLTNDTAETAPDGGNDLLDEADFLAYSTGGSTEDTVGENFSTINAGSGDDIIVLDSNETSMNTIVVDGAFGYDRVVNFFDQATNTIDSALEVGDHILDFSAYLTDTIDTSTAPTGNSDSAVIADTNVILATAARSFGDLAHGATAGTLIGANDVGVIRFDSDAGDALTTETFAGLNATTLLAGLNGAHSSTDNAYGSLTDALLTPTNTDTSTYTDTTQNHIIMVENDLNEGEYKVFHVTSTIETTGHTITNDDFTAATELGTFDFGASVNMAISQEESVMAALTAAIQAAVAAPDASAAAATEATTVDATQAADGSDLVLNKAGNMVNVSTIKEIESTATLSVTQAQAVSMSGVTGAITVSTNVSTLFANAIDDRFSGVVTATISDGGMTELAGLDAGPNAYTITITDTTATAASLTGLDAKTSVAVTTTAVDTVTGTATEVQAYGTAEAAGTLVDANDDWAATLSDTSLDATTAEAINAFGTGAIDISAATTITATIAEASAIVGNTGAAYTTAADYALTVETTDATATAALFTTYTGDTTGAVTMTVNTTTGDQTVALTETNNVLTITNFASGANDLIDVNLTLLSENATATVAYEAGAAGTDVAVGTTVFELTGVTTDGTAAGLVTALGATATNADLDAGDALLLLSYTASGDAQMWYFLDADGADIASTEVTLVGTLDTIAADALVTADFV